jgi:polyphenol oxidase
MSGAGPGLIAPDWPAPPGVRAAFTLRTGGVSAAPYDSLNMGAAIGDTPEAVAENRRLVREALRMPAEPVWLEQVHGTHVVALGGAAALAGGRGAAGHEEAAVPGRRDAAGREETAAAGGRAAAGRRGAAVAGGWDAGVGGGANVTAGDGGAGVGAHGVAPRGDASVAWGPGRVCAIRVADCMPVLFAAQDGSVVGAAHAGWRGLAGGVLEATVERMGVPPPQLIAWMGPAIGQANFEVGQDVRLAFTGADPEAAMAFLPNARGRWQCDLYALARRRLGELGVAHVYGGGWCTFADSGRFFSYRRSSQCGRMAALIWMD